MKSHTKSIFSTIISMMISPRNALKHTVSKFPWGYSIVVSTMAFGLFFFLTGFDLYKTGQKGINFTIMSLGAGVLYGGIIIPAISVLTWVLLKTIKSKIKITFAISSFCLSYCGMLIYCVFGLVFTLILGWKVSIAFGVTGILWSIGPMVMAIREMSNGKDHINIFIATLVSCFTLITWTLLGQI